MMHEKRYQHFCSSGQSKLKLEDALQGYFDVDTPETYRSEYQEYIRKRIRPAGDMLAESGRIQEIAGLLRDGLLSEDGLADLLSRTKDPAKPAAWMQLMLLRRHMGEAESRKDTLFNSPVSASGILTQCKKDLYACFPMLDAALAGIRLELTCEKSVTDTENGLGNVCSTDGERIIFEPGYVIQMWNEEPMRLRRGILHILMHCMYGHLWDVDVCDTYKNLACDVFVEFLIERECWRNRRLRDYFGYLDQPGMWSELYDSMGGRIPVPDRLVKQLKGKDLTAWHRVFSFDDHSRWPSSGADEKKGSLSVSGGMHISEADVNRDAVRARWQMIMQAAGSGLMGGKGSLGIGTQAGDSSEYAGTIRKGVTDYRKFLQQFAVSGEEMELDLESFDYIYYTLGMQQYDEMPFIEPLEYREGHKLEELVIAIDTSGSCKKETVQHFLEEVRAILEEKENFFRKMNVWIIQCDCVIQNVAHITSRTDWDDYVRNLKIEGRAGTDFRPVFRYVDKLRQEKQLKSLKGLIYFTDGDGAYPREATDYQTAFAFLQETESMQQVPGWAKILVVGDCGETPHSGYHLS